MNIAIASYGQETSSFSPVPTTLDTFKLYGLFAGDEILQKCRDIGSIGGFLQTMDAQLDWTPVPIIHGWAGASGALTKETLAYFAEALEKGLRDAGPLDAMYFALHGAAVADGVHDTEAYLLRIVRGLIGNDIPLVISLDHHANLTDAIVDHADALVAHRTQPHDQFETGELAAQLLLGIVRDKTRPTTAWRKIPLITHQEQFLTAHGPMKQWFDLARDMESRPGVLSASTLPMQPWLDVPQGGWAAAVVTDNDPELADKLVQELADEAWALRESFCRLDSITPEAAMAAGVAGTLTTMIGGKLDPNFGTPTQVTAKVAAIGGGRVDVSLLGFESYDLGSAALLEIGEIRLVVSENRGIGGNHPSVYEHFGLDVADARMLVVKTASNWQFYQPWIDQVIRVDTPGATTSHLEDLPWQHLPRPIYPLDSDATM